MNDFREIPGSEYFRKIEPVDKGWSNDQKYFIETKDARRLLLRVSHRSQYHRKQAEFEHMQQLFSLGVPMSQPLAFGTFAQNSAVYQLLTWCDGADAETAVPLLPETEQYVLGVTSGEILRKIHTLPAPETQEEWAAHFRRKTRMKLEKYRSCGISFDGDSHIIAYLESNWSLLENRPQCCQHGDYHIGNMILSPENQLFIIDFNRQDFGDPWEEFNRISWSAMASPHFATGQLVGYFSGRPPMEFFQLLAFYIASNALSSVYWAIPFGQREVDTMLAQNREILLWYDNMKNPVPTWFLPDFYFQYIDQTPCKLKQPFDLSFLCRYGTVFQVFDDQDSGNLCFGTEKDGEKYFVKFAGAPSARSTCTPEEAIANLKAALPLYHALSHEALIMLVREEAIGGGYAAVFRWAEGICMGRMYPKSFHAFRMLSTQQKLQVFSAVLQFHIHVHAKGYVAVDFYDGSILYDPETEKTTICDIDFYAKKPYVNHMGRLWGSSVYMSPEEFLKDAKIDETTNVYTMGALAFALFADYDRSPAAWTQGDALYTVAKKATRDDRAARWHSIAEMTEQWNAALQETGQEDTT